MKIKQGQVNTIALKIMNTANIQTINTSLTHISVFSVKGVKVAVEKVDVESVDYLALLVAFFLT